MLYRMSTGLGNLLLLLMEAYEFVIFAHCILSFMAPQSKVYYYSSRLTEPLLGPIRRFFQRIFGFTRLDFSPYVLILLMGVVRRVIYSLFF